MISLAIFIAKDLITWCRCWPRYFGCGGLQHNGNGDKNRYRAGGQPVCVLDDGALFPHDRPFVENIGYNFLHHGRMTHSRAITVR